MANIQYVAIGRCSNCGQEFVRPYLCTHAVCSCTNPHKAVPLKPVLLLPTRSRLCRKLERIADLTGISIEKLVNALLLEAGQQVLSGKLTIKYKL